MFIHNLHYTKSSTNWKKSMRNQVKNQTARQKSFCYYSNNSRHIKFIIPNQNHRRQISSYGYLTQKNTTSDILVVFF